MKSGFLAFLKKGPYAYLAPFYLRGEPGRKRSDLRHFFSCQTKDCPNEVSLARIKSATGRLCDPCEQAPFVLKDVPVRNQWVRDNADKYSHSKWNGRQYEHFMKCQNRGCKGSLIADKAKKHEIIRCSSCQKQGLWGGVPIWRAVLNHMKKRHRGQYPLVSAKSLERLGKVPYCGYCCGLLRKRAESYQIWLRDSSKSVCGQFDRMNNDDGYREGNLVPCCKACNVKKGANTSARDMLVFALAGAGNHDDASAAMKHESYLDALAGVQRKNHRIAAQSVLAALRDVGDCAVS